MSEPCSPISDTPRAPHKMYVIVRRDLAPGLRAAQGMHAVAEICLRYPEAAWEWNREGNYMIVMDVKDEAELLGEARFVPYVWKSHYLWNEPDLDYQLTAMAVLPESDRAPYFSTFPLAYKETWFDRFVRWTGAK